MRAHRRVLLGATGLLCFASYLSVHGFSARHEVRLSSSPGGEVHCEPDQTNFSSGEVVRIFAEPEPGFRFCGWEGADGSGNPLSVVVGSDVAVHACFEPRAGGPMSVGTNLGGPRDWTGRDAFVDAFKRSRPWMTRNVAGRRAGGPGEWDTGHGAAVPVDERGWPTRVPFTPPGASVPQLVHTVVGRVDEEGEHTFLYRGTGVLVFRSGNGPKLRLPTGGARRHEFLVEGPTLVAIEIHETAAPDHLRDFEIVPSERSESRTEEPFDALFLERLAPFSVLRFMDWGATNGSPLENWAQRTKPDSARQSGARGVALEYMIRMADDLGADAWICIPHAADDEYVARCASLVRDALLPTSRVWVEYSNETWNTSFEQARFVRERGLAEGLSSDPKEAGHRFAAARSARIWGIFQEELGDPARLVKVLGSQSTNTDATASRVAALHDPELNPRAIFPDALAIAPYFGKTYGPGDMPPLADSPPGLDEVLGEARASLARVRRQVAAQRVIADRQGWSLVAYEGGQHLVGKGSARNDSELTGILTTANRSPRMGALYREYLDLLETEGVELVCIYTFCRPFGSSGSWGVLERLDQPLSDAHKYAALTDWILARSADPSSSESGRDR